MENGPDPKRKLVTSLINHYEPDAVVDDAYYESISKKHPNTDTLVSKLITHYEPDSEVTTEYLSGLYSKYGVTEKKNVVGASQPSPLRGIGGSSDLSVPSPLSASVTPPKTTFGEGALEAARTPEPKKQIPVPPKPIEGLGKQEAVSYGDKLAEDIVESAMNRPYELAKTAQQQIDSGDYVVNGKKVTEYEARKNLLDRGFVAEVNSQLREGTFQSSGILKLGKNASPETVALANHQIKSQGEFDEFKSLQSGLMGLQIGIDNMPNYLNLMMEQATGVPNAFFTTFMSVSPEMKQMAISGEAKDRLTKYVANLNKIKEGYSESKFKIDDPRAEKQSDFIDLFNQGRYGEMGRTIVNSTLESGPIMIGAAAIAAMTGNPMTGAAFLVPQSASTRLADIQSSKDIKVKGLTPSERLADVNISGMAEGIPEALMGPVVNKSFKLFKQGVQQGIKRIFEQGGKDAAIDAAEGAAKETAAKLIKNYGNELALGYGEEAATSTITEFKDVYLGTSDKTILEIIRTINNDGMIGSLSQGLISTPGTGIALANKAALNGRRLFDKKVSTPEGQEDLKEFSKQYAQKNGQNEQEVLASIEARIKAVNAVPKRLIDDTKTIDLVQEKQDLTEQMRNLDDAFKKPLADRIAKIEEEIAYRAERNEFIKKREALVGEIDGITDAPDGIKKAYQDFEEGKEVPLQDLQKASDWAYSELKRMRAMKGSSTSELSQERVDDYIDLLTRDVSAFEDKISELKNAEAEFLTEPVINSTPTDEKYASVNNNDGKGTVDLTKQEYLDWKAKNKPVTEQLTTSKTKERIQEIESLLSSDNASMQKTGIGNLIKEAREELILELSELKKNAPTADVVQPQGKEDAKKADYTKRIERKLTNASEEKNPIKKALILYDALDSATRVDTGQKEIVQELLNAHLTESGLKIENVEIGSKYNDTNTSLEATISGEGIENLKVIEVLSPIIRDANGIIVKQGKVIVESSDNKKTEQNAKEQQSEQMREQGVQEQPQGKSDSNMPIVNQTELQDGKAPKEEVVGAIDVESRRGKQLEIINKTNPAPNNYNTWIRKVEDIKTADEVFEVAKKEGAMYPDFTEEQMQNALDSGEITIYSSNPIENGVFVTPSKMNAQEYAGGKGGKLYSKKVKLEDIAWIDESEGQYAVVEQPQAEPTKEAPKKPVSESELNKKPFIESFGTPVEDLNDVSEGVMQTNLNGVDVLFSEVDGNTVKLESIETPEGEREQGKAKKALQKIIDKADELGKTIVLSVVPKDENTTEEGLRKLYEGFGFVATEGKNMERVPNAEVKETKAIAKDSGLRGIDKDEVKRQMQPITDEMAEIEMQFKNKGLSIDWDYDYEIIILNKKGEAIDVEDVPSDLIDAASNYEKATAKLADFDDKSFIESLNESRKRITGEDAVFEEVKNELPSAEKPKKEQVATREELQKELYKLFDKKDATDVFDVEDMQAVDKEIERVSTLLEALPKEETQIAPEQEFTDEEIAIAYAERQDALKEIDSKEYKSRQIHNMFTKIPLHEYLAMGDRKYYKGSEKFFRNLVDKDAPSTQNSIEDMANEMSEAAGIEITEGDIIKYIEDIVADRIKGEDSFGAKELKSKKGAPKKGRKAPTVSRKEKLLAERKALIDKIKSGLNEQGFAFNPKNAANDSKILLNDLIKWAQIEIELGSITAKEFIDMVIKEKGYDWRGPARRAYTIGLQTMPDVPFKDVKEKVRLLEKAALAEITSAMKKGKREGIKEGEQKEKEKAEKAKEKAREAAKESKEKAVAKAIEKAKQKYVNIGARIGEAFGNLEGQIAGKAKGIKEAAQMQKWFTQQVNAILEDMIAEAKESNPGFSITPQQLKGITKRLLSVNPFNENSYAKAVEYMGKVLEDATYIDKMDNIAAAQKAVKKRKHPAFQSAVNQFLSIKPEMVPDALVEPYMKALKDMDARVPSYRAMQDMFFDIMQNIPNKKPEYDAATELTSAETLFDKILEASETISNVGDYMKLLKDIQKWRAKANRILTMEDNPKLNDAYETLVDRIDAIQEQYETKYKDAIADMKAIRVDHILSRIKELDPYKNPSGYNDLNLSEEAKTILKQLSDIGVDGINQMTFEEVTTLGDILDLVQQDGYTDLSRLAPILSSAIARQNAEKIAPQIEKAKDIENIKKLQSDLSRVDSAFREGVMGLGRAKYGAFYNRLIAPMQRASAKHFNFVNSGRKVFNNKKKELNLNEKNMDRIGMVMFYLREHALSFDPKFQDKSDEKNGKYGFRDWFHDILQNNKANYGISNTDNLKRKAGIEFIGNKNKYFRMKDAFDSLPKNAEGKVDVKAVYESFKNGSNEYLSKKEMTFLKDILEWESNNIIGKQRAANEMRGKPFDEIMFHILRKRTPKLRSIEVEPAQTVLTDKNRVKLASDSGKAITSEKIEPIEFNFEELFDVNLNEVSRDYFYTPALMEFNKTVNEVKKRISDSKKTIMDVAAWDMQESLAHELTFGSSNKTVRNILGAQAMQVFINPIRTAVELASSLSSYPLRARITYANAVNSMFADTKMVQDLLTFTSSPLMNRENLQKHFELERGQIKEKGLFTRLTHAMAGAPERVLLKPIWYGRFQVEFFNRTGERFSPTEYANPRYKEKYRQEILDAASAADAEYQKIAGSATGIGTRRTAKILPDVVGKALGLKKGGDIDVKSNAGLLFTFMTGYQSRELEQVIEGLKSIKDISKEQGVLSKDNAWAVGILGGAVIGTLTYTYLSQMNYIMQRLLLPGDDEDEEEIKKELKALSQFDGKQIATSLTSLSATRYNGLGRQLLKALGSVWYNMTDDEAKKKEIKTLIRNFTFQNPYDIDRYGSDKGNMAESMSEAIPVASIVINNFAKATRNYKDVKKALQKVEDGTPLSEMDRENLLMMKFMVSMINATGQFAGANIPTTTMDRAINNYVAENKPEAEVRVEELKANKEKDLKSFSEAIKKEYPNTFITNDEVMSSIDEDLREKFKTDYAISEDPKSTIRDRHNIDVVKESKDEDFIKVFISSNGKGKSFSDSEDFAVGYYENISKKGLSDKHRAILEQTKSSEYIDAIDNYFSGKNP